MTRVRLLAGVLAVALIATTSCGGTDKVTSGAVAPRTLDVKEAFDHEGCDESGNRVEMLDTNGDGRPDIRRVFDKQSGRELCRVVDLNHDGQPDLYEYFDASGAVRRRESCYDDTGTVNAIESYEGGRLAKRVYDTSGQRKIDTWDYFDPGLPADPKTGRPPHPSRRERDTTGHGRIDQWWTWNGAKVTIVRDLTGEGNPDPKSSITLGEELDAGMASAGPAARDAAAAAGDAGTVFTTVDAGADAGAEGGKL